MEPHKLEGKMGLSIAIGSGSVSTSFATLFLKASGSSRVLLDFWISIYNIRKTKKTPVKNTKTPVK